MCTARGSRSSPQITSDGDGGAVVVWKDTRGGYDETYVQHLDPAGAPLWHEGGEPALLPAGYYHNPYVKTSPEHGSSIILVSPRREDAQVGFYAQRLTGDWSSGKVAADEQREPPAGREGGAYRQCRTQPLQPRNDDRLSDRRSRTDDPAGF